MTGGLQAGTMGTLLAIVITGVGAAGILIVALSWLIARWWCKPRQRLASKTPAEYRLPFEPVEFSSAGVPVRGWFIPAEFHAPSPAVVLAHGWSSNAGEMLPLSILLREAGIAVLLYDTRGHGASGKDGPITIRKFAEDILAAIEYLATRFDVDPKRLGVLGRSIGGGGAILAASSDSRVRAVASCSTFADPEELTRDYLDHMHITSKPFQWLVCRFIERWLGARMADMAPKNRIGRITAPLMLIHGDSDGFIAPSNMEVLYAEAPRGRTERLSVPGRGHSDVMNDGACIREIVGFFREHLALPSRPVARGAGEAGAITSD